MNAYFTGMLAKRDGIPTADYVERMRAVGVTRYAAAEVRAAFADLCDAHDEAVRAYAAAAEYVESRVPADERQYPGWEQYVSADVAAVLAAQWEWFDGGERGVQIGLNITGDGVGRSGELYPLTAFAKRAAKFRRSAKQLRKAVDAQGKATAA